MHTCVTSQGGVAVSPARQLFQEQGSRKGDHDRRQELQHHGVRQRHQLYGCVQQENRYEAAQPSQHQHLVSAYNVTLSEQVAVVLSVYTLKLPLALQDQTYLIPNGFAGLLYISGSTAPSKMARLLNMTMTAVDRPCLPVQIMTSQEGVDKPCQG